MTGWCFVGGLVRSAGGGGERFELVEGGEQLLGPRPVVLQTQLRVTAVKCESVGDVQQPEAQPLGLGVGELAVEQQRLGPDEQVVREHDDLQPHLVERERLKRELRQAGVLVVADAVFDVRALAVAALDDRDLLVGLVGEDRLEAVAVVVGEAQLRAGVRALAADDQPRARGPGAQLDAVGDLGDLAVVALAAVLRERRNPRIGGNLEDRRADGLGQLIADREADARLAAVVDQAVRAPAASVRTRISICSTYAPGICSSARSSTVM